jgi:hypothetical protein
MELVSTCAIPHQVCGGQNSTEAGFSSVVFFLPHHCHFTSAFYFAFTTNAV